MTAKRVVRDERTRAAHAAYKQAYRAQKRLQSPPEHVHGTVNGYGNYGCRCTECRAAQAQSLRDFRKAAS